MVLTQKLETHEETSNQLSALKTKYQENESQLSRMTEENT